MNAQPLLRGRVVAGRGVAKRHLEEARISLLESNGVVLEPGSLNLILEEPVMLDANRAITFEGGHRAVWPGILSGEPIWVYRWANAPLHVAEILAEKNLREACQLVDGAVVEVRIADGLATPLRTSQILAWQVAWEWREEWIYRCQPYIRLARWICFFTGALQKLPTPRPK